MLPAAVEQALAALEIFAPILVAVAIALIGGPIIIGLYREWRAS